MPSTFLCSQRLFLIEMKGLTLSFTAAGPNLTCGRKRTDIHNVHYIMTYLPFTKVLKRTNGIHTAFHGPHPLWMRSSQVVRASDWQFRSRILVSIPASSYSVESEGRQMQCTFLSISFLHRYGYRYTNKFSKINFWVIS